MKKRIFVRPDAQLRYLRIRKKELEHEAEKEALRKKILRLIKKKNEPLY